MVVIKYKMNIRVLLHLLIIVLIPVTYNNFVARFEPESVSKAGCASEYLQVENDNYKILIVLT